MAGSCCVFLLPRRPSSLGYRALPFDHDSEGPEEAAAAAVTVVVGKERREFLVDPFVLQKDPFRVLLRMTTRREGEEEVVRRGEKRRKRKGAAERGKDAIFVDVDAILFEHLLWLVQNGDGAVPTLLQRNLEEIIEFYAQDY